MRFRSGEKKQNVLVILLQFCIQLKIPTREYASISVRVNIFSENHFFIEILGELNS